MELRCNIIGSKVLDTDQECHVHFGIRCQFRLYVALCGNVSSGWDAGKVIHVCVLLIDEKLGFI